MRLTLKVFCLAFLAVALLAGSATSLAHQSTTVGKGTKRCVPEPGADCRGVVERWTVEYHGDLRKAKFTGAVLHGADFRGADLRGADFRGAKLRHADFRGAKLKGARFDKVKQTGKNIKQGTRQIPACATTTAGCQGADLNGATLSNANLDDVNLSYSILDWANFTGANLTGANLSNAYLYYANLHYANLTGANLTGVFWLNTTCPNGTITDTGC